MHASLPPHGLTKTARVPPTLYTAVGAFRVAFKAYEALHRAAAAAATEVAAAQQAAANVAAGGGTGLGGGTAAGTGGGILGSTLPPAAAPAARTLALIGGVADLGAVALPPPPQPTTVAAHPHPPPSPELAAAAVVVGEMWAGMRAAAVGLAVQAMAPLPPPLSSATTMTASAQHPRPHSGSDDASAGLREAVASLRALQAAVTVAGTGRAGSDSAAVAIQLLPPTSAQVEALVHGLAKVPQPASSVTAPTSAAARGFRGGTM